MRACLIATLLSLVPALAVAEAPSTQGWSPGRYEAGRWIEGPAQGRYDADGRWIPGPPAGRTSPQGLWLPDPAPGYWDDQGRWRAGAVMGEYDEQGRWRTTAPGVDPDAAAQTPASPPAMARPLRPR
jgi:hypothetical protein